MVTEYEALTDEISQRISSGETVVLVPKSELEEGHLTLYWSVSQLVQIDRDNIFAEFGKFKEVRPGLGLWSQNSWRIIGDAVDVPTQVMELISLAHKSGGATWTEAVNTLLSHCIPLDWVLCSVSHDDYSLTAFDTPRQLMPYLNSDE